MAQFRDEWLLLLVRVAQDEWLLLLVRVAQDEWLLLLVRVAQDEWLLLLVRVAQGSKIARLTLELLQGFHSSLFSRDSPGFILKSSVPGSRKIRFGTPKCLGGFQIIAIHFR